MKRYENFQDCPTPWLAQVPSHWRKLRYKDLMRPKDIKVGENSVTLLSLTKKGVIVRDISEGKGKFPSDFSTYKIVEPNDLIMCLFDVDETPRTVGIAHNNGMITGAYDIFNVLNVSRDFLLYHFLHIDDKKAFKPLYKGLRKVVPLASLLSSYVYLPPLDEQEAIVEFLDSKTSKIDTYVRERERELTALEELRQAEIARVVTHGLNPDAPMRDSGIPWLGKIPAHWKVRKMKFSFNERSEKNHPNELKLSATQSHGVIPQSMYEDKGNHVVDVNKNFEGLKLVKVGDFVIHLRSFQGGIAYAHYQGIISAAYTILTPKEAEFAQFYRFLFTSHPYIQLLKTCVTGIREGQNIDYAELGNQYIPIPPIEEQRAIVDYINAKTAKIDGLIADLSAQIEKLKEYKQRLIADAVTGQVDVRK